MSLWVTPRHARPLGKIFYVTPCAMKARLLNYLHQPARFCLSGAGLQPSGWGSCTFMNESITRTFPATSPPNVSSRTLFRAANISTVSSIVRPHGPNASRVRLHRRSPRALLPVQEAMAAAGGDGQGQRAGVLVRDDGPRPAAVPGGDPPVRERAAAGRDGERAQPRRPARGTTQGRRIRLLGGVRSGLARA